MAVVSGCEPYDLDFGDREYAWWLAEYLSPLEHHDRMRAFTAWYEAQDRWARRLGVERQDFTWSRAAWAWYDVRLWLLGPLTWRLRRAYRRFDALARERGGPPPGPSFKVRMDWGGA